MKEHFDLIAMPKGQLPGGAVQASDGRWYHVIPADVELPEAVEAMVQQRAGRPVSSEEKQRLLAALQAN